MLEKITKYGFEILVGLSPMRQRAKQAIATDKK